MKAYAVTHGSTFGSISFGGVIRRLATAWNVARERRALANVDARTLADMGISPEAAAYEAARPVWDLPSNR